MPISTYLRWLRNHVGRDLVLMPGVTGIVTDQEGRVLLVEDISTGWWALPGGAIDPDERPADAIVREMREELGVEVEPTATGVASGPSGPAVASTHMFCDDKRLRIRSSSRVRVSDVVGAGPTSHGDVTETEI